MQPADGAHLAPEVAQTLERGLTALELALAPSQHLRITQYLALLNHWNRVMNLTAIRDPKQQVIRHVLDCMAIYPHIQPQWRSLCDVGTGAGLPGVMMAIVYPKLTVHLVESALKKSHFLRQLQIELALDNVVVHANRVEDLRLPAMDALICRAFSSLAQFVQCSAHLGDEHSRWLAMKGNRPSGDEARLPAGFVIEQSHQLDIPFLHEPRCLLCIRPSQPISSP